MAKEEQCDCIHCKYLREEISKDFYVGYLQGKIDTMKSVTDSLASLGYQPSGLSSSKSIGQYLSAIEYNLNCCKQILDSFLEDKK